MKRNLFGLIGSLALASSLVAAQGSAPQTPTETQKPVEVVLTGCIIQGSAPTIFILDNAKVDPADTAEKGRSYMIESAAEDVVLKTHLNHQVRVTGVAEKKPLPDPDKKVEEKDLPKFSAKSATMVADRCTPAAR
jgi:hypothetical protein